LIFLIENSRDVSENHEFFSMKRRCDGCGSHQAVSHARVADWQVNSLLGV